MASLPSSSSPQSQSLPSPSPPPPPPPPIQIASSATLLSGAASGLVSCVLLQPLDLLKTRLQQANSQNAPIGTKTRRLAKTVEAVVQRDGIRGLWRGTWPTILRNVPGVALYFYSVTELRRMLALQPVRYLSKSNVDTGVVKATSTGNLLSGATARVAVGFMLCPITVVKARFEVRFAIRARLQDVSSDTTFLFLLTASHQISPRSRTRRCSSPFAPSMPNPASEDCSADSPRQHYEMPPMQACT